jgi:putative transposase
VLQESGALADSAAGWNCYVRYIAELAEEDVAQHEERFAKLCKGWAIGSADFKAQLQARLLPPDRAEARLEIVGADREAHRQVRAAIWEDRLQRAAGALKVSLASLPAAKSASDKVRLAALLKHTTSVSNVWLTQRLQMGKASSVSQFLGRFRRNGGTETSDFKHAVSRVAT